jgi:hypothetical protein
MRVIHQSLCKVLKLVIAFGGDSIVNIDIVHETLGSGLAGTVLLLASLLLVPATLHAQDWTLYDELLATHVAPVERESIRFHGVDYAAWAQDPRYPQLLAQIESHPLESLQSEADKLAFYINVYNVYAIRMVIDNAPLTSIRDAGSLFSPVWKKPVGSLGGRTVTLDEIEHQILRPMGEPRIHFAIVCASLSCPDLRRESFSAERLDAQLQEQTQAFLDNASKGLQQDGSRVRVSQIFDWFEDDFDSAGGVEAFVRRYRDLPDQIRLRADIPYNWNLNAQ